MATDEYSEHQHTDLIIVLFHMVMNILKQFNNTWHTDCIKNREAKFSRIEIGNSLNSKESVMKKTLVALAVGAALSTSAVASNMYIDVGSNAYELPSIFVNADTNTTTGIFTQFGFTQMLATSIYELNQTFNGLTGSFYDTNSLFELGNLAPALPATGTAMDGVTPVTISLPTASGGQQDLDSLAPMVLSGPATSDSLEGFGLTWRLMTEYHFDGVLGSTGPNYTGGYFNIYFDDLIGSNDRQVLGGTLTGSQLQAANLNLFFDITMAETGFLFIDANNTGNFVDAATLALTNGNAELRLDTNVDPPIPSPSQLLVMFDGNTEGYAAVRQTTLDGSISPIPEPGTLALFGAGLLGLGFSRRRKV